MAKAENTQVQAANEVKNGNTQEAEPTEGIKEQKTQESVQSVEMTNEQVLKRLAEVEKELAETKALGTFLQKQEAEMGSGKEQAIFEKNLFAVMEKEKQDTVTVTLPIDMNGEDSEVFVGVNGYNYLIKRGEPVEVPKFVAEVLANSEKQMVSAIRTMNSMEQAAEEKMGRL